jgi:Holliday junction DNA helicase RuvA
MISRIRGKLVQLTDSFALVENGGLSYEVQLPSALADRLKEGNRIGGEIEFETIHYVEAGDRKSNHYPRLVGFTDPVDREFFSLFIQVPGLGVRKALKSLVLPVSEVAAAIENKDSAQLQRLPGVGGRLADKIVAELVGKCAKFALARSSEPLAAKSAKAPAFVDEAMDILVQLQYNRSEAKEMVDAALKANPKVSRSEDLISLIFKSSQASKGGV